MSWDSRRFSGIEVSEEHSRSEGRDRPYSGGDGRRKRTKLFEEDSSGVDERAWVVVLQICAEWLQKQDQFANTQVLFD